MLKKHLSILLALCLAFGLGACGKAAPPTDGIVYTDALGAEVTLPKQPQTVAVLLSSFADIWVTAGGAVDITVGETVERGFATESACLVDSGAGKTIDTEALIAAEPDLVIGSADLEGQSQAIELCRTAGIPAVALRVEQFSDYLEVLKLFTQLTGQAERYTTYGTEVADRIDAMCAAFRQTAQEQTILFIRAGSGAKYTKAKTAKDHFAAQILEELGTVNIADAAPVLLDGLSFEEILTQDPDYIFISTMGDEQAAKSYMDSMLQEPQWQALRAVAQGHTFYLPKSLFQYKPNAQWDQAYAYLIDLLTA